MQLAKLKNSIVITVIIIKILIILLLGLLFVATSYAKADLVNIMSILLPVLLIAFFIFMKGTTNLQGHPQEKNSFLLFLSLSVFVVYMLFVVALMLYRHDVGAEASSRVTLGIGIAEILLVIYLVCIFIILRRK